MINRLHRRRILLLTLVVVVLGIVIFTGSYRDNVSGSLPELDVSRDGVPVLAYHFFRQGNNIERTLRSIGTVLLNLPLIPPKNDWTISAKTFEKHLQYLQENGYETITLRDLVDYMRGEIELSGKCVVITFDDGDESVYRYAYPLLKKYGMKGTLFLITSKVGQVWSDLTLSASYELREMQRSEVIDIESHTHDLHYKIKRGKYPHPTFMLPDDDSSPHEINKVFDDLKKSRLVIERLFRTESAFLAWPFGFGSALADSLAREAGFEGIVTLKSGANLKGESPYTIRRYTITARTSMRIFREMVAAQHDPPEV
jgi:peptidoglycan/xylan/chitin deacetylase (PgdA/CDA1 family)